MLKECGVRLEFYWIWPYAREPYGLVRGISRKDVDTLRRHMEGGFLRFRSLHRVRVEAKNGRQGNASLQEPR